MKTDPNGTHVPYLELQRSLGAHSGPLHTRAKSRDHEIVRAQKKVSKGRPKALPKPCSVVTNPQV